MPYQIIKSESEASNSDSEVDFTGKIGNIQDLLKASAIRSSFFNKETQNGLIQKIIEN